MYTAIRTPNMQATNGSLSISALPTEIICEVFKLVIFSDLSPPLSNWFGFYKGHLSITAVCRQWRKVAIDHGPLWTMVPLTSYEPEWTCKVIQRSRHFNLTMIIHASLFDTPRAYAPQPADVWATLLPQLHRVRALYINIAEPNWDKLLSQIVLHPAPRLRELRLSCLELPDGPWFNGSVPPLVGLQFHCTFAASSRQLAFLCTSTQLADLSITSPQPLLTLHQLLHLLRSIPNLQTLELSLALSQTSVDESRMDPVPLKSLTNLQMADFTTTCLSFLSHVDINPESTVSIRSVCEDDDYLSIPLILACYAKTIEKQQDASVRELAIDETPDVFTIWADTLSTMSEEDYQFRGFTLKMEHISPTPPWVLVFSHLTHGLLSAFPLKYLRSLRVTHIPLSQAEWRDIFGGLCFLQSVTLLRDELDNLPVEFVRALSTENDDVGSGSPTIATLFPALVSLSFDQAFNLELFDLLCSALEARKGLGYPLESLRFKRRPYVDKTYFLEMHQRLGLQCQVP